MSALQTLSRRKLLTGLGLLIAAPAIVKASSLMPVKAYAAEGSRSFTSFYLDSLGGFWKYEAPSGMWSKLSYEPNESIMGILPGAHPRSLGYPFITAIAAETIHAGQPVVLR